MSIASLPPQRLDEQRIGSSRLPSQRPYRLGRNWGRIGTAGQAFVHEMTEIFATEAALEVMARLKRREGFQDL
jgi:predicted DNA-binding WGR domain protein